MFEAAARAAMVEISRRVARLVGWLAGEQVPRRIVEAIVGGVLYD